jgi:hypothetical protein
MGITDDDMRWARNEANRLHHIPEPDVIGYNTVDPDLIAAIEFLRLKAGPRSEFYLRSADAPKQAVGTFAAKVVASSLLAWADFVQRGIAEIPAEAQARIAAATDLMEQVESLLQDRHVHPAAPVMLAGAALEELLRSMVDASGAKMTGKPSIGTYADALRAASVITAQEVKDVTSWAGMRNNAAHGQFDQIELANARLMAQAVNLFMQKHVP